MAVTVGIDLRCLPADGAPGAGVAHAARNVTDALIRLRPDVIWELTRPNAADILFVPCGAVSPRATVPTVPWVHDVAIFEHPEWFPQSFLRRQITTRLFLRGLRRSKKICAASAATKNDLVRLFRFDPSRIVVTHEGGDSILAASPISTDRKPLVLFLGTVEPRKNLPMLLDACRGIDLVIAGRHGWRSERIQNSAHVRRIENVSDEERRTLLQTASIVAVPSLHEGFGLVALEAMQAGTPVVASNVGALPEVVGDAGILLDPHDAAAWRKTIVELLADDARRAELGKRGKERSKLFSWEKTATRIMTALTDST